MRPLRARAPFVALALALAALAAPAARAQPADAYTLPELVTALSRDPDAPGAIDAVLAEFGKNPAAAALLSPEQKARLREAIVRGVREGKVEGLDAAPVLTVAEMGAAVRVAPVLTDAATGGARTTGRTTGQSGATSQADGLPAPRRVVEEDLGLPAADRSLPADDAAPLGPLGALGLERGGGARDAGRAQRWPDSKRLADVLNRLSLNPPGAATYVVRVGDVRSTSPAAVIQALQASGHGVSVQDRRRTANFADLRHEGRSVAAPVWIDTELPVPGGAGRTLRVPATHSEHQVLIRGPLANVDVAFFMGIDGEAKFRPLLGEDPEWVGGRVAHVYEAGRAVEAVRVAGEVRRAFGEKMAAHPDLPYGGYFNLGVCNDSNAFIEQALTGRTTLYPLTRDPALYQGGGEIDRLSRAMPIDGRGAPADLDRVLAALPTEDPDALAFDGLRADVKAVLAARGPTDQAGQVAPTEGMTDQLPQGTAPR